MANINELKNALDEVKEYLVLNKYNKAMMLMAQITIHLVEHIVDENLIVSKGYEEDLKTLTAANLISDNTKHNFEALIISGVQAHKGVAIPKEHAEQSLEVLTNELSAVEKSFAIPTENIKNDSKQNRDSNVFEYNEDDESPAFMSNDDDFRKKERIRQKKYMEENKKSIPKVNLNKVIVLLIPIVLVLVIAFMIRSCIRSFSGHSDISPTAPSIVISTDDYINEGPGVETVEETTIEDVAGFYVVTADKLNVRVEANTNCGIVVQVSKNDVLQVVEEKDEEWWHIKTTDGRDGFVMKQYVKKQETSAVPTSASTEVSPTESSQ